MNKLLLIFLLVVSSMAFGQSTSFALKYSNGSEYFGQINKDNKRHGLGVMTYPDENKKYGQWVDDRFVDSKDTKISLYKSFSKNERFRPIEIFISNDMDCEDIKRSTVKKLIFDQLAHDGESIESLCALDNRINRRCINEDKNIYTEKWREFIKLTKITMSEPFTKLASKNIEICEVDVSIASRYVQLEAPNLLLTINKTSLDKTSLSLDTARWIELTTQSTDILKNTIFRFKMRLLYAGEFDARKTSFKFDPLTKKVFLQDTLSLLDFDEDNASGRGVDPSYYFFNKKLELYYKH